MAKGKHAASANARKLREAEARIEELENQLREQSDEAHRHAEELKAQVRTLEGRLIDEVEELASRQVEALVERHEKVTKQLREEGDRRVREGLQSIGANIRGELSLLGVEGQGWVSVAEAFGIDVGELLAWAGSTRANRGERRMKFSDTKRGQDQAMREDPKLRVAAVRQRVEGRKP